MKGFRFEGMPLGVEVHEHPAAVGDQSSLHRRPTKRMSTLLSMM